MLMEEFFFESSKTYKLDCKGHFGKISSVGFNHDADFDADHDAEILRKRIKQAIKIGLQNSGAEGFSITAWLGWCSSHQSRSDQISTHLSPPPPPAPPPNFYIHQIFTLSFEVGN